MTSKEFKRVGRMLKRIYVELEDQALSEGIDATSDEYVEIQNTVRSELLKKIGFTDREYVEAKQEVLKQQK